MEPTALDKLLATDGLMGIICNHLANGGSLIELCEDMWKVRYGDVEKWIRQDAGRKKQYDEAIDAGNEYWRFRWVQELRGIGALDITKAWDANGVPLPIEQWPIELRRAVAAIDIEEKAADMGLSKEVGPVVVEKRVKKVKFHDKLKALEMIAKHLGLMVDRHEVHASKTLEDLIALSMKPAAPVPQLPAPEPPTTTSNETQAT